MHLPPPPPSGSAAVQSKAVVLLLLICVDGYSHCGVMWLFYVSCALIYVHSGFAIILVGKSELVAWLSLSFWWLVTVV